MRIHRLALCLALAAAPAAAVEGTWTPIGPEGGSVQILAASPVRPNLLYASLLQGRLLRSADGGKTWTPRRIFEALDLALDAGAPETVYAATGFGFWRSTDRGASWAYASPPVLTPSFRRVLIEAHPRTPGLLLGVHEGILYRSADRGVSWTTDPAWPRDVQSIAFVPGRPNAVYLGAVSGVWKSTDAGRSWTRASRGLPPAGVVVRLAVDPRSPQTLYAAVERSRRRLFKSTDGGATWKLSQKGLPEGFFRDLAVDANRPSVVYALVGHRLFRSRDGGGLWEPVSAAGRLGAISDLEPTRSGLLAGTATGVYRSTDRGATWSSLNRGLFGLPVSGLAISDQDPPRIYASAAEAGVLKTRDRGESWLALGQPAELLSVDQALAIDPAEPETLYLGGKDSVEKSTNGGRRWTARPLHPCSLPFKLEVDPHDTRHVWASVAFLGGCGQAVIPQAVFHSRDAGLTWERVTRNLPNGFNERLLAVDPFDGAAYVQATAQTLWKIDRDAEWELLATGMPALSLAASPQLAATLWAGQRGAVGRSRDGGRTWTFFSTGLPAGAEVIALTPDPADAATLYAGAPHGVFRSTDAGETWSPAGIWPAHVRFSGRLVVDPADPSTLYAATDLGVLMFQPGDQPGD